MSSNASRNNIIPLYDLCTEAIWFAQAERKKITQKEGSTRIQIKHELLQLGDSSILKFTDWVVHIVFKHLQELEKDNESFCYSFSPQKYLFIKIKPRT